MRESSYEYGTVAVTTVKQIAVIRSMSMQYYWHVAVSIDRGCVPYTLRYSRTMFDKVREYGRYAFMDHTVLGTVRLKTHHMRHRFD